MNYQSTNFLPYLLNQAAELVSREFQPHYKDGYGMLRTEWRVLFHLGRYGEMTAKQICEQAALHKTKVSRAIRALETKRFILRRTLEIDRRSEMLALTKRGQVVFGELSNAAASYDKSLEASLGPDEIGQLKEMLSNLIQQRAG